MSFGIFFLLITALSPGHTSPPLSPPPPPPRPPNNDDPFPRLRLSRDNTFTLTIFSDLHFGEDEHSFGPLQDELSAALMGSILDEEPATGLVVLNGDLITGENTFRQNSSAYVDEIVAPMAARRVPWASTYGNHDSSYNLSREAMLAVEAKYRPLSRTQRMEPRVPGITNYYLLLYPQDAGGGQGGGGSRSRGQEQEQEQQRPAAVLWFFDSRGGFEFLGIGPGGRPSPGGIPSWVAPETAAWFAAAGARLRAEHGPLPGVAFVHIPPRVFLAAQEGGLDASRLPGLDGDVPVAVQGGEDGAGEDRAFVDALRGEEGLHSVYVGHDHGAAWCAPWPEEEEEEEDEDEDEGERRGASGEHGEKEKKKKRHGGGRRGPFLCFSKHTGYGGYGKWNRGARVIRLAFVDENGDGDFNEEGEMRVQTWVRMEGGSVVTNVTLNETYGVDRYPTANGEDGELEEMALLR
ncbi:Calcineurin-like phosphoesterase [Pleurostoma richardsiae]|uniref:Calcineurin-like phosphoesterase n=1 Tax=Pleurostoma richardsiae TaxID=41990 RepID=A0AA38R6G2_9PEZI|nr:Calcineurin-like phosphoesterase [Pleurostoma richardsiae]